MSSASPTTVGGVFRFWLPLASTWLMMSVEGPFLAAIIARLDDPKYNLAAYGVAFAWAIIVEAPVIMILSASNALAAGASAFRKMRNFTQALNGLVTAAMLLLLLTPLFEWIARDWIGLNARITTLTHGALLILIPWPGAIGYRRFYQGLLIRNGKPRLVAYGTVVRLAAMAITGITLFSIGGIEGAYVGAAALSVGVCTEAVASRFMAWNTVRTIRATPTPPEADLTYGTITSFYYPLALTASLSLAAHPIVTFFMGQARDSLSSLAVLPVINALSFVFRSMGLALQDTTIALMTENDANASPIRRYAWLLGIATTVALAAIAWTPLARVWFQDISGLDDELTRFATGPLRIISLMPALSVLLGLQRAALVFGRRTVTITLATMVEVGGIVLALWVGIHVLDISGATVAAVAFMVGRIGGNLYLARPASRILKPAVSSV